MHRLAPLVTALLIACGGSAAQPDGAAGDPDAELSPDAGFPHTLDGNRDRLLATYLAYLQSQPDTKMSNGLLGRDLHSTCDLWADLDPSSRAVFLTLTHRLEGSKLTDGSAMLDHVTRAYRIAGGDGATATDPGTCGGGEANRMIMALDDALHAALVASNTRKGAQPYDLVDVNTSGYWRDSHDVGGTHAPFDQSDETNDGAPRGQVQYFADLTSPQAQQPLGRTDVESLVEPHALEMDQDYDCVHSSNPLCDYTFYGTACAPQSTEAGTAIYADHYGDFEPAWQPTGC